MASSEIATECRICFEIYVNPRLLPCRHSYCQACVNKLCKGSSVKCPTCESFCNVDQIVHDSRLEEFVAALKEKEQELRKQQEDFARLLSEAVATAPRATPSAPPEHDVPVTGKCELCEENAIEFWCEDCGQWLCSPCKKIHLNSNFAKNHSIEELSNKNKEVESSMRIEIQILKGKISDFQLCLATLQRELRKTQDVQMRTLQQSRTFRDECVLELNKCFDRIDNFIRADTEKHSSELEHEKNKLEHKVHELERQCHKMEDIIKKKEKRLAVNGAGVVQRARELVKASGSSDVSVESISLQLRRLQGWSTEAVTLEVTGGGVTFQDTVHADESLERVSGRRWQRQHSVYVPDRPHRLRLINGELFQCHRSGITVYNTELQWLRTILIGCVFDVAATPGAELVVAARNGLYHTAANGAERKRVAEGCFTGVVRHGDRYYAVNTNTATVTVYRAAPWTQCHSFKLDAQSVWSITMNTSKDLLYVCLDADHRVDVYTLTGQRQYSAGRQGSGDEGLLNLPLICATDSAGTALIADMYNHRLCVLSAARQWSSVQLQPAVKHPYSAFIVNGRLLVNEHYNKSLCIYTLQN